MYHTIEKIKKWTHDNLDYIGKSQINSRTVEKIFIKSTESEILKLDEILYEIEKAKGNSYIWGELRIDRGCMALYFNSMTTLIKNIKENPPTTSIEAPHIEIFKSNLISCYKNGDIKDSLDMPEYIIEKFKDAIKSFDDMYNFVIQRLNKIDNSITINIKDKDKLYSLVDKSLDVHSSISNSSLNTNFNSIKSYILCCNQIRHSLACSNQINIYNDNQGMQV